MISALLKEIICSALDSNGNVTKHILSFFLTYHFKTWFSHSQNTVDAINLIPVGLCNAKIIGKNNVKAFEGSPKTDALTRKSLWSLALQKRKRHHFTIKWFKGYQIFNLTCLEASEHKALQMRTVGPGDVPFFPQTLNSFKVISLFSFSSSFQILICFCFGCKRHQLMKFKSSPRKLKTQNGRIVPGRSWMVFRSENPSLKRPSTCLGSQVHKASTRGSEWVPAMYCGRLYPLPLLFSTINKPNANK